MCLTFCMVIKHSLIYGKIMLSSNVINKYYHKIMTNFPNIVFALVSYI